MFIVYECFTPNEQHSIAYYCYYYYDYYYYDYAT